MTGSIHLAHRFRGLQHLKYSNFLVSRNIAAIHYREGGHAYTKQDWSVVLDFTKVQLCGKEKTTGYKSMRENENKAGYSWRCPKTND